MKKRSLNCMIAIPLVAAAFSCAADRLHAEGGQYSGNNQYYRNYQPNAASTSGGQGYYFNNSYASNPAFCDKNQNWSQGSGPGYNQYTQLPGNNQGYTYPGMGNPMTSSGYYYAHPEYYTNFSSPNGSPNMMNPSMNYSDGMNRNMMNSDGMNRNMNYSNEMNRNMMNSDGMSRGQMSYNTNSDGMNYSDGMNRNSMNSNGSNYSDRMNRNNMNSDGMNYSNGMNRNNMNSDGMNYSNRMNRNNMNSDGMNYSNGTNRNMMGVSNSSFSNGSSSDNSSDWNNNNPNSSYSSMEKNQRDNSSWGNAGQMDNGMQMANGMQMGNGTQMQRMNMPVLDILARNPQFSTFYKLLQSSNVMSSLQGQGPFTIFAPTNAAFEKLSQSKIQDLLKPDNRDKLKNVLLYHVVNGKYLLSDLKSTDIKSLEGDDLSIKIDKDKGTAKVEDARVITPDMMGTNGVVQGIDTVLMP